MQRTSVALSCALILAAGSAFAQQQGSGSGPAANTDASGPTLTDKAKQAAQTIGEKTKEAVGKVKAMTQDTARSGDGGWSDKGRKMQEEADADFKAAKAKCDSVERKAQQTVCEKQAAVAHANAELRIAKAEAASQGGNTSAMGAGKSAKP